MSPKKDEYMRAYGDGFKDGRAVKALEWRNKLGDPDRGIADTSFGSYDVDPWWPRPGDKIWAATSPLAVIGMEFASSDEGKAAAQADFETRIRSALKVQS